jgi:hypothetical protein
MTLCYLFAPNSYIPQPFAVISGAAGNLPPELISLLREMLADRPEARPENVRTVVRRLQALQKTAVAARRSDGPTAGRTQSAIQRRHLEQEYNELQSRYDTLSRSIAALDIDISRTLEVYRRQPFEEVRAERAAERDQVTNRMDQIEATLAALIPRS